jgi:uncharacterized protein YhbP (UPF0306 family)
MEINGIVQEILSKGYLMSLATVDDGGVWAADVTYVSDEKFNIYWVSSPEVRHSKAIHQNSSVAGTITISQKGEPNMGVQLSGIAEQIEEDSEIRSLYATKRGRSVEEAVRPGVAWYKFRPELIEVIHEPEFGFKKQKINL